MNSMYLLIILGVVLLVFGIIGYYLYQEAKFRKMVENTFNQKTDDILMHSNKKIVFEGESRSLAVKFDDDIIKKDKVVDEQKIENTLDLLSLDEIREPQEDLAISKVEALAPEKLAQPGVKNIFEDHIVETKTGLNEEFVEEVFIPEDSMEAFFAKFDKIEFQFANYVNKNLDLVIDVIFEETIKIKSLPDIAQFTEKTFSWYILDKSNLWSKFESGKKYVISGLKLVVELVDRDGIINQAQIANVYNAVYKFVLDNHGHIRMSDYASDIENIRNSVNHIEDIELDLSLYLVLREQIHYRDLITYLQQHHLTLQDGIFVYKGSHGEIMFELSDKNGKAFEANMSYKLFTITSKMHLQRSPLITIDKIFDFAETFNETFESRLLTTNKLVFGEKEYKTLTNYINDYINDSKKYGIELGGDLLKRVI